MSDSLPTPDKVRYLVRFSGHVQGVGFRATTVAVSRHLNIHGFVRNEADGSVQLDVEGPPQDVDELLRRIKSAMSNFLDDTQVETRPLLGRSGGIKIKF